MGQFLFISKNIVKIGILEFLIAKNYKKKHFEGSLSGAF